MARYTQVQPGEWVQPKRRGYKLACCQCSLVHRLNFRLVPSLNGGRLIQFQAFRDERATSAVRREKRKRMARKKLSPDFIKGFTRACLRLLGRDVKWTNAERRLFNVTTRRLFGRKR